VNGTIETRSCFQPPHKLIKLTMDGKKYFIGAFVEAAKNTMFQHHKSLLKASIISFIKRKNAF
jgi:hypothetical protein